MGDATNWGDVRHWQEARIMSRLLLSVVYVVMLGVPLSGGWAGEDPSGVSLAAEEGPCDWRAGGPHKMHWPQLPD
jgi:hypothetical protein